FPLHNPISNCGFEVLTNYLTQAVLGGEKYISKLSILFSVRTFLRGFMGKVFRNYKNFKMIPEIKVISP
ncbi:MAG: hypothetical protein LBU35_02545, partial [Holosporales bacterium]|nr:hypothetical protein [Holosporales bacterium]